MKLKKVLSLLLAAALLAGVALAAEPGDQELLNVTARVKTALELDTEQFTDFQGWSDEDVLRGKRWTLNWTGDGVNLTVTADGQGKIYSYNYSQSIADTEDVFYRRGLNIPQLPEEQSTQALAVAQDFLTKVLTPGVETVELEDDSAPSLRRSSYRFSGMVKLNGVASPISCSVTVRPGTLEVTRFWRSDEYSGYVGDLPSASTGVATLQARRLLKTTLSLDARYILDDDGKTAHVLYVPQPTDEYYVDGQNGALVNLTQLRKDLGTNNRYYASLAGGVAETEDAAMDNGSLTANKFALTQAEKDGAAILQAAMSKEDLSRVLQNTWPELGLAQYTLSAANYSIVEKPLEEGVERTSEDYDILCRLSYGKKTDTATLNKFVTVDAKTGELKGLYSHRYYDQADAAPSVAVSLKQGETKAAAFLKSYAGANADKLAVSSSYDCRPDKGWQHTYTFSQTANGYFYYGNFAVVGIDAVDGTISQLSYSFDEDVELVPPGKIITAQRAAEVYGDALDVRYGYLEIPVSVGLIKDDIRPLLKQSGYNFVTSLKPGFVLEQPQRYVRGVDAVTGEVVLGPEDDSGRDAMTYSDLDGLWVKEAAEALAVYRVGFWGGELRPNDQLTQPEMLALLLSVDGYVFGLTEGGKDTMDDLYAVAYSMNLITPAQRDEKKILTRGELVKLLLDGAGYQKIAGLSGIYRTDFSDAETIPADQQGYAALAQGLGLVKGGSDGAYAGNRPATRAEAVAMLYQYMK